MTTISTPPVAVNAPPEERATIWRIIGRLLRPAIVLTLALTVITGLAYPAAITGLAQLLFPSQSNGSIVSRNGQPIASSLIGQYWVAPQYFHGLRSATVNLSGAPAPYEAGNSAGSNLGPANVALQAEVQANIDQLRKDNPDTPATTPIPIDLVTSSASGLDPDISVAGAYYQIPRIAKARGMTAVAVQAIIDARVHERFLGIFGEPFVSVLELNMALDHAQGK